MTEIEKIKSDISVFSDIGTGAPSFQIEGEYFISRFYRLGNPVTVKINRNSGQVSYQKENYSASTFASYKSLLASEDFANLRAWAATQFQILKDSFHKSSLILTRGRLNTNNVQIDGNIDSVEKFLLAKNEGDSVRILLIDGPAGIGKTKFVENLAFQRAKDFSIAQNPLILHVKSRGRVLTYLQDLMAFSLQSMRLTVTYDQVPVLVRLGLVQLAIDGFDELGDPNGYETAWGQIRSLVEDVEGSGAIILAGRETFIGRDRLLKAVPRLSDNRHSVGVFSILPTAPNDAKNWLLLTVPSDRVKEAADFGLFDHGSYALRPFFLAQIGELLRNKADLDAKPPLLLLAEKMIEREATKFPDSIQQVMNFAQRIQFVESVLSEAARDMAENQADSIDEDSLMWIVETVVGDGFDSELLRLLKNRIQAVAFLEVDDRASYRRFAHSEFYNLFLSKSVLSAVCAGEIPKYLRRGILGPDFLIIFGTVIQFSKTDNGNKFAESAIDIVKRSSNLDRSQRNTSSLIMTCLPIASSIGIFSLKDLQADDVVIRGISSKVAISDSAFNQLDLREADLSAVTFDKTTVSTVIADSTTRFPESFPEVGFIEIFDEAEESLLSREQASEWINTRGRNPNTRADNAIFSEDQKKHSLYQLLQRASRAMLRQHWIRTDGDDHVTKIVESDSWNTLKEILSENELLEERNNKPASGPPSVFYHIKHARQILEEDRDNPLVLSALRAVSNRIRNESIEGRR